ncbi:MAG TPA: SAM-dependent methyltransferase [Pyrinomonadaceae bacterium]|nr:SAM-dependent methyltransferase [Pyrinomonadaceae bacterium]
MIETVSKTSPLVTRLRERIKREGPMTFRDWMRSALYDPTNGYYCRTDLNRWGTAGDYRTSPERSSLFAATFARYFGKLHHQLGKPPAWTVIEVGAGDGHFAEGTLQTFEKCFPDIFAATNYVLDEISPHSRALAARRLQRFGERVHFGKLDDSEINTGVVFANELLDAFPVHRVMLHHGEYKEFYVDVDDSGKFQWLLSTPRAASLPRLCEYFETLGIQPHEGQVVEVNLEIEKWLRRVALSLRNGFVIAVDYGASTEELQSSAVAQSGTLRGFRRHRFVDDLLADPGEHDLTTTVNWSFVKAVGARLGFEVCEFERQDRFLLANGFLEQLEVESGLAENEAERLRLSSAAREMILPEGMAAHFQVLVVRHNSNFGGS